MENKIIDKIIVYTDGGCRGNPGPGGWGVVFDWVNIESEKYNLKKTLSGSDKNTTNNKMELTAAIQAIKYFHDFTGYFKKPVKLEIYTDSKYVQQGITQWIKSWKTRGWKNASGQAVKNQDLWRQLDSLVCGSEDISWHWVKGHSGHAGKDYADRLANAAMDSIIY